MRWWTGTSAPSQAPVSFNSTSSWRRSSSPSSGRRAIGVSGAATAAARTGRRWPGRRREGAPADAAGGGAGGRRARRGREVAQMAGEAADGRRVEQGGGVFGVARETVAVRIEPEGEVEVGAPQLQRPRAGGQGRR